MKYTDKTYTCYLHFEPIKDKDISISNMSSFNSIEEARLFRYKLEIIKLYKQLSGWGLKECKDYVDNHLDENRLAMLLTKTEIYRVDNIKVDQWGANLRDKYIGFHFDGVELLRDNLINEIIKND